MMIVMKMFGGVLIFGRIAATHLPAHHAHAQVNPGVAEFYAFFADVGVGRGDFNLIEMLALAWHCEIPLFQLQLRSSSFSASFQLFAVPLCDICSGFIGTL